MSTWDAVWAGLIHILQPTAFLYMMLGIVISSTLVALPGIGSKTAIALLLPLAFTLDKFEAICLIVSVWAVSNTANSITSILFAVPGGSGSQATILDGYPMARNGEAVPGTIRRVHQLRTRWYFWSYCVGNIAPSPETSGHFVGST